MKSALFVWSGPDNGTSANLFRALEREMSLYIVTRSHPNPLQGGSALRKLAASIWANTSRLPAVFGADCIIVHSYASLSLPTILAARLLRRQVYVFNWDVYPSTIAGVRSGGVFRRIMDNMERFTVSLATCVVVPTSDFASFVTHENVLEMPLWPSSDLKTYEGPNDTDVVKIAFAGQIDNSRGLDLAIGAICRNSTAKKQFHVFSSGVRLAVDPAAQFPNCEIIYYDHLPRERMQQKLAEMNFGLVSLNPKLDQPGYPSKIFDYIAANLPVLYYGRSLPEFTRILEESGVGRSVGDDRLDLALEYRSVMQDWTARRNKFLDHVKLSRAKLVSIFAIEGDKCR